MFALALLLPFPQHPVIPAATLPLPTQWQAVEACPVIAVSGARESSQGSGAVIGVRDGFAYILTAAHVVPYESAAVQVYTQARYPEIAWRAEEPLVVKRWDPRIDLALVRIKLGSETVPVLPLAPIGRRPKQFPVPSYTVGAFKGVSPTLEADTILAKRIVRLGKEGDQVAFFWEMTQPSRPGRSGGPLLDSDGRVIGICSATQSGRGYYVHTDEIHAALKRDGGEYSWLIPTDP